MIASFAGLHRPVKGTKVSTVLSTPGQVTIPPSYLDIGMGGHFEGFGLVAVGWVICCRGGHQPAADWWRI